MTGLTDRTGLLTPVSPFPRIACRVSVSCLCRLEGGDPLTTSRSQQFASTASSTSVCRSLCEFPYRTITSRERMMAFLDPRLLAMGCWN